MMRNIILTTGIQTKIMKRSCIEYIVVHEIAHLKEHRHNKDFIAMLDKYLPDWQLRKKELDDFIALPFMK